MICFECGCELRENESDICKGCDAEDLELSRRAYGGYIIDSVSEVDTLDVVELLEAVGL